MSEDNIKIGSFNSAQLQMFRLHELFLTIDRCNTNLFNYNPMYNNWNFLIVANNLDSILATISAKLTTKESEEVMELKNKVTNKLKDKNLYSKKSHPLIKTKDFNETTLEELKEDLFSYRIKIENLMDTHGLSNPNMNTGDGWD